MTTSSPPRPAADDRLAPPAATLPIDGCPLTAGQLAEQEAILAEILGEIGRAHV